MILSLFKSRGLYQHCMSHFADRAVSIFFNLFLAFDFCRYCVVIRFFHPRNDHDFEGFSIPDCIPYIYFLILILEKEPAFSLLNVQC